MSNPLPAPGLSTDAAVPPRAQSFFTKAPVGLLALATVACLVPFIGKAFHIDDPLFLWTAKQIHAKPWDFYGFTVNWYGYPMPMTGATENPPLAAYYIAAATSVFGWGEIGLHLAFLLPAVAAVLGTYYLARELCPRPLFAAFLALLSPTFLLCSTNIMSDTLLLSLWVWAVVLWTRGLNQARASYLAYSGLLISCCELTKFFGLSLIPLLAAYSLATRRPLRRWVWALAIPVAVLALYQWLTARLYGQGGFSFAAGFSLKPDVGQSVDFFSGVIIGLAFTGGSLIAVLFFALWLWPRRWVLTMCGATVLILAPVLEYGRIGWLGVDLETGFGWRVMIQAAVFVFSGLNLLLLAANELWRHRFKPDTVLLAFWVLGTFVFAWKVNWTVSGRSLLPLVPAAAILIVKRLETQPGRDGAPTTWPWVLPLTPAACIALLVTWSDYRLANTSRDAAKAFCKEVSRDPHALWFQGHWGFQYYMEQQGAKPIDFKNGAFSPGTCMASPAFGANLGDLGRIAQESKTYAWASCRLLTPFNMEAGAGYHASLVGPLPYALIWKQQEVFTIYEVTNSLRLRDGNVISEGDQ